MTAKVSSEQGLTPKQETFLQALLAGHTIVSSAVIAGIAEKTAHKWLKLPHFQAALKAAQKQLFDQALTGLMLRVDKAIETLDRSMSDNPLIPPSTQVRSAQIVLEQAINIGKMNELEEKYAALEALVKGGMARGNTR